MGRTEKIEITVSINEKEVIERGASILGVSTAYFVRSAALAQAIPMEDCRQVVLRKRVIYEKGY